MRSKPDPVDQPERTAHYDWQLSKRAGFDNMGHHLGLTTGAQVSVCWMSSLSIGPAVTLTSTETVQWRPVLSWEDETYVYYRLAADVSGSHISSIRSQLVAEGRMRSRSSVNLLLTK